MAAEQSEGTFDQQTYDEKGQIPFRHIELLGQGSFGYVDKVQGSSGPFQGQIYARKIIRMPLHRPRREIVKTSIENEVKIVKTLRHNHIVHVAGTYICGTTFAIVMTPVAEENLAEHLHRVDDTTIVNEGLALRGQIQGWFGCMASALSYVHAQGIRHRDIKPANFLVMNGNILLTDFGIALEHLGETLSTTGGPGARSPMYCAPEVASGHRRGRLADVFSLGAVFLEMLTVCSGRRQLTKFTDFRQSDDDQSYASNTDKVFQWMELLDDRLYDAAWCSTIVFLCRNMLQTERDQRPTANDLRLCWSYQPFSAVPLTPCEYCQFPDIPYPYRIQGINEALQGASQDGHKLAVCLLIEKGAAINDCDALHRASEGGQVGIVEVLIRRGANVDGKATLQNPAVNSFHFSLKAETDTSTQGGETPLQVAAFHGHVAVAKLLLKSGADILAGDSQRLTALHFAAGNGQEAIVRLLADKGAHVEAKSNSGWTALHIAAMKGQDAMVQLLLEKRANIEERNHTGWTALHIAAWRGQGAMVRLLLEKGANIETENDPRWTVLHAAAKKGQDAMVRLLLEKGAKIEAENNSGWTALHIAAMEGRDALVRLLLEKKAHIEAKSNGGCTALCFAAEYGHETVVRFLVEKGAHIESRKNFGWTALHISACYGHKAVVQFLVEEGANIEARTDFEWTALHTAAKEGQDAIVRLLLEKKAHIEAKSNVGCTTLYFAAEYGHEAVVRFLVKKGANIESRKDLGWTALHISACNGHRAVVRFLVKEGADTEARNYSGLTARNIAVTNGDRAIVRLLTNKVVNFEA
ncbi:MAG: hypothetical protein M1813_009223 [Trichoglossum hirsutum]|nr:MAG: hypothetical protein M1813_009223 [Trichoglossum hirsutum]